MSRSRWRFGGCSMPGCSGSCILNNPGAGEVQLVADDALEGEGRSKGKHPEYDASHDEVRRCPSRIGGRPRLGDCWWWLSDSGFDPEGPPICAKIRRRVLGVGGGLEVRRMG